MIRPSGSSSASYINTSAIRKVITRHLRSSATHFINSKERCAFPLFHDLTITVISTSRLIMYSLMSRKEIRDFNRLFEPNAFNTGPPIPTLLTAQAGRSASPLYLPELTSSPASSSSSLSLEDDEIRKIFSDPRFDPLPLVNPGDTQVDGSANVYAARGSWNSTICYGSTGEELNPKAAPFVPSFLMSANLHNPQTTRQTSLFFPPERSEERV